MTLRWFGRASVGLLGLLALMVLTAPGPAAAVGAYIVYRCGDASANLCRINPDGGGQMALTGDGRDGAAYGSPSLSRDGARLAFNYANKTYVGEGDPTRRGDPIASGATIAQLRGDGGALATIEDFPEQTLVPGVRPTFFTTFTPFIITYDLRTAERKMTRRLPTALAWAGNRLVTSGDKTPGDKQTLCLLNAEASDCARVVARDNARDLTDPAVSPDGTLLAVTGCAEPHRVGCGLSLYSMATAEKVRDLTAGPDDTEPAWSSDGQLLVFTRAGDLFVTPAAGGPGAERVLVRGGRNATWGGMTEVLLPTPVPAPAEPPPAGPPPPAPVEPALPPAPSEADAVALAVSTAADALQVPADQLTVVSVELMEWSDASLGCPEPGRAYAQVITLGYLVVLTPDDGATEVAVHTDSGQRAVIC